MIELQRDMMGENALIPNGHYIEKQNSQKNLCSKILGRNLYNTKLHCTETWKPT